MVDLAGNWDFYWDTLTAQLPDRPAVPAPVPGRWSQLQVEGRSLPANGQGTYHLRVLVPSGIPILALRLNQIDRAYRLFCNGKELPSGFSVAPSSAGEGGSGTTRYYLLDAGSGTLDLMVQVSSHFDSWGGGIPLVPLLGTPEAVSEYRAWKSSYEMFLVGLLLIMGLYHLMLFLIERKDKALVVFALVCFASLARQMVTDESFLVTLFQIHDEVIRRAAWLFPYLLVALFLLFYDFFFPWPQGRLVSWILKIYGFVMAGLCLVASQSFYSFGPLQHYYIILSIGFICVMLVRGITKKQPYSMILLVGSICLSLPAVIDIFSTMTGGFWTYLFPVGTVPFLLTLSFALARRYTQGTRDAESLRVKNSQLAELDQSKTNFFANVSHELRTPLTLILGPLEGIQRGAFGSELSKTHPVFALMRRNTTRILRLVDNLLKISRIASGLPLERVPVNLPKTLKNYLEEFQTMAESGSVTLKLVCCLSKEESEVLLDPQDLETIMLNLLSNAVKYTPPGGMVTLTVSRIVQNQVPRLLITVQDTGIGMDEAQLHRLFQRFTRVYDTERGSFEGTGIGLSIAREAAQRHQGTLTAASTPGRGSVFTLDLPYLPVAESAQTQPAQTQPSQTQPAQTQPSQTQPAQSLTPQKRSLDQMVDTLSGPQFSIEWPSVPGAAEKTRRKILFAEDNPELREYLTAALSSDFQVLAAEDGQRALEILDQEPGIELIVSDIMMPRMDGIAFFKVVRSRSLTLPFLFLTALASDEERLDKLRNGALDYLLKPFSPEELKARIFTILEWQEQGRIELKKKLLSVLDSDSSPGVAHRDLGAFGLSPREGEVMEKVAQGLSDKEIASALGLSQRTVSNHVGNLLKKTGKKSRGELMGLYFSEARPKN